MLKIEITIEEDETGHVSISVKGGLAVDKGCALGSAQEIEVANRIATSICSLPASDPDFWQSEPGVMITRLIDREKWEKEQGK